jgi:hypothetical protein
VHRARDPALRPGGIATAVDHHETGLGARERGVDVGRVGLEAQLAGEVSDSSGVLQGCGAGR